MKCHFYIFTRNFSNISAMQDIKISSRGEKYDKHFYNKRNAEFCIVFSPIYPALKATIQKR